MSDLYAIAESSLGRTRSAVLNVLIASAVGIAVSGVLLRERAEQIGVRVGGKVGEALTCLLIGIVVASFAARRVGASHSPDADPQARGARFYRSHLLSALIAFAAVPLGLFHGWQVRPQFDAIAPYWVAALGLGILSIPRASELAGYDLPVPEPSEPRP